MNASSAALVTSPRSLASSALSADPLLVGLVVKGPSCGLAPSSRPIDVLPGTCVRGDHVPVSGTSDGRPPSPCGRLEINRTRRGRTCAAIQIRRSFGCGRYEFVVNSDLTRLDPWIVLGRSLCRRRPGPHQRDPDRVAKWGRRHPPTPPRSRAALSHAEHQAILHGGAEDRHHEPEGARMPGRGEVEHQVLLHRRVGNVTWKDHAFADAAEMRAH
jgi:hypothetical protein